MLTLIEASSPRWGDERHTFVVVDCLFAELEAMGSIGFAASPHDCEPHGRTIYQDAVLGKFGPVAEFVAPEPQT